MSDQAAPDNWHVIRSYLRWFDASWRWSRACLLARLNERCDSRWGDDEFTQFAVLHQHYAADGTLPEQIKSCPMIAAVAGAIQLAHGPEIERLAVEGRLIALETVEAIASKTGQAVKVLEAFEMLFCDFRDKVDCDSWMCDRVLGAHIYLYRPQTLRTAVLRLAFRGGPNVADAVLQAVATAGLEPTWDKLAKAAVGGGDTPLIDRLCLLAVASEMVPRTVEAVAKLGRRHRKVLREAGLVGRDSANNDSKLPAEVSRLPLWEHLYDELAAALTAQSSRRPVTYVA